ncbi:MAG: integrase [Candidatus Nanoarchaeia archaeon]
MEEVSLKEIVDNMNDLPADEQNEYSEITFLKMISNILVDALYDEPNINTLEEFLNRGKLLFNNLKASSIYESMPKSSQRLINQEMNHFFEKFEKELQHKSEIDNLNKNIVHKEEMISYFQQQLENTTQALKSLSYRGLESSNRDVIDTPTPSKEIEAEDIDLSDFYTKYNKEYVEWINNREDLGSRESKRNHIAGCKKIFEEENIKTAREFDEYFERLPKKNRTNTAFRGFIMFCSKRMYSQTSESLLSASQVNTINNLIKGGNKDKGNNPDAQRTFRPKDKDITGSLNSILELINNTPSDIRKNPPTTVHYYLYLFSIESGGRFAQIERDFFKTFDMNKVAYKDDEIVVYNIGVKNHKKFGFYLFCRRKTFDKIISFMEKGLIDNDFLKTYRENIRRWTEKYSSLRAVDLVYHRKYINFLFDKEQVPSKYQNFIASRVEDNVNAQNYTDYDIEEFLIPYYKKILPYFNNLHK